jgi:hypothetical protein
MRQQVVAGAVIAASACSQACAARGQRLHHAIHSAVCSSGIATLVAVVP